MNSIREALREGAARISKASCTPVLDARVLLKYVLKKEDTYLFVHGDERISKEEQDLYELFLQKREQGMPVAYIIGSKEFMGLEFKVNEHTLIPRPDTEIAVMEALEAIRSHGYKKVLDLCCGSGAIGLSIAASFEFTNVTLSDINKEALDVANENAVRLGLKQRVQFVLSDLFSNIEEPFDLIVSNPPYISGEDMEKLDKTVREYEPHLALYGGDSGLDFYRSITQQAPRYLRENGMLIFEIGYDQSSEVEKMMKEYGFKNVHTVKDFSGLSRVVSGLLIPET
ncbi:peptide chain release factor N(5)-glutamine methyltransferase [Proteiniclasticum ruminis]|uniref:peptide chain release factor N(5)-glutamine methyltransferase n=1 Tax=Proteiniclasticum ruminis TaxID=398199 RepID=UPI0028964C48|nr:peptide chain release factor N(5)-glutamine methyltransferase [Proteiniclasticum ruminis]